MTPKKFYSVQQAGHEASIHIFGDIVSEQFCPEDVSAYSLLQQIEAADADVISVYIDSYGGLMSAGWAIYNQLKQHRARIRTYGVGFVASAALYPFLAGDERYAVEPSAYFLHPAQVEAYGSPDDLRAAAGFAEQMTEIGLAPFEQSGVDLDLVRKMMQQETWLSPTGALQCGIATGVLKNRAETGVMQSAKPLVFQKIFQPAETISTGTIILNSPPQTAEPEPETNPSGIMQMIGGMFKI